MLLYDNRGRWRLILHLYGSIYRRVWFAFLTMAAYSVTLFVIGRRFRHHAPAMDHPFAAQSLSTLIAFVVCFRVNIAWARFWESCREVATMISKWCDAFSQLQGFITSTIKQRGDSADVGLLEHTRFEVTHFFSLLSAVSVERLMRGDIRRMEMRRRKGVAWSAQVVEREHLRSIDLTGATNLFPMRVLVLSRNSAGSDFLVQSDCCSHGVPSRWRSFSFGHRGQSRIVIRSQDSWQTPLSVIGECSKEELTALRRSKDRVTLLLQWINEVVTNMTPDLNVPAPIMSRVFQEMSNGALGYSQAEKLADIPFPFIFAQLLAVAMFFIAILAPITFTIITGDSWLTPLISTVVVICFWALNEIAKELENPFGDEPNNVPLVDEHERFVSVLCEMHGQTLPKDRAYRPLSSPPITFGRSDKDAALHRKDDIEKQDLEAQTTQSSAHMDVKPNCAKRSFMKESQAPGSVYRTAEWEELGLSEPMPQPD